MLIFDFDGVLVNSLNEVVMTAYNAATSQTGVDPTVVPAPLAGLFKRNRFHFQSAGDAVLLMQWCLVHYENEPEKILSADEYQEILQSSRQPLLERLHHFYDIRSRMMTEDIDAWRALNTPFQPIWQALIERGGKRVVLLTNKNREAVSNLCRYFNLAVIDENIYSGDNGATKIENLESIRQRFMHTHYRFLDDSVKNLRLIDTAFNRTSPLISLLFAQWGYSGPNDKETAQRYGYTSCTQDDIIHMLDRELLPE